MDEPKCLNMVVLAGEQAAPNLLPARYFRPQQVIILHTNFPKIALMAERLSLRLKSVPAVIEVSRSHSV